jgi:hypothetical protein
LSALESAVIDRFAIQIAVRIPPFFWAVMLILGFNEIMALLGNPLLLFMFVVLGLVAYAAWLAGLLDVPIQIATGT